MHKDLTQGSITKTLILFALPLILGNILQQFYNVVDTFVVGQLKEKFGQLRIYHNQPKESEIAKIIQKYAVISLHVCIHCGALDVPLLDANWIRPMCRACYAKSDGRNHCDYDAIASPETKIAEERVWETWEEYDENKRPIYIKHTEDISATVQKLRENTVIRLRNNKYKELMIKYPWTKSPVWGDTPEDEPYCMLEDIPYGWFDAFGEMMCEELDALIKQKNLADEFRFDQIKEKYGELRLYAHPYDQDIEDVLDKYSLLSGNICINCGEPDVPMLTLNGWVEPYCKNCYTKIVSRRRNSNTKAFEEMLTDDNHRMAEEMRIRKYSVENGHQERVVDVHETANKIRERYQQRQKDSN